MNVAVIGIGGRVGSRLGAELLARGHRVTGIERHPKPAQTTEGLTLRQGDATQPAALAPPGFPEAYKAEARAGVTFLEALRAEKDLDWTFLSPSAEFAPGTRTGTFRLGRNELLTDRTGRSWVSMEDFAIALVDELEHPRHRRERFTVGY